MIAGRTVFVGLTAPGLGPAFPTPVTPDAASMTGVQLQASVLDGLRGGMMIDRPGWARGWSSPLACCGCCWPACWCARAPTCCCWSCC